MPDDERMKNTTTPINHESLPEFTKILAPGHDSTEKQEHSEEY